MRVGEAVGLDTGDVDLAAGVIVIRETKFNKSRRIPLQPSTVAVLRDYLQLRQRLCPAPKALCFFVSSRAGRITTRRAQAMFARLVKAAGLEPRTGSHPRVHDYADLRVMPTSARSPLWRKKSRLMRSA